MQRWAFRSLVLELKLSLYADDLLLYMSEPLTTIPPTLSMLDKSGSFSGDQVYFLKSECFSINSLTLTLKKSDIPFQLSPSESLDQTITSFLWGGKTPRVKKSLLQKYTLMGVLPYQTLPVDL